jgi:DNA polymerase-3 subunit alpha
MLLVKNRKGYLQLCELLAQAWLTNQYKGRAEIRFEWLQKLHEQGEGGGLIALSGAHFGDVGVAIDNGNLALAEEHARRWESIFPDHFYIEIQRAGQANMENHVRHAVALAKKLRLPVVATHPVQFLSKDDYMAHEARVCISEGDMLANGKRVRRFNDQQCFKTQAEMQALFADMPAVLQNSVEIAKRCNLTLELGKPKLPDFPTPDGMDINEFLVHEAKRGLEFRLQHLFPNEENVRKSGPL